MSRTSMRIWIDLAAPPQVLFFRPVWQALRAQDYALLVTIRDFSRAPSIASRLGIPHVVVGRHGGRGTVAKGAVIIRRALALCRVVRKFRPQVAVSHNSYAQALAASLLRIPLVTAMDYEHQPANHLSFRLASRVLVPQAFPASALRTFGASEARVVRYPGVKEEVYLSDFVPDPTLPHQLGFPAEKIVVTVRPPATSALYHRFDNPLFETFLSGVAADPRVHVVLLDRTGSDWSRFPSVSIPTAAIDGPNLVWWSDVVIGAGGTMTREAAVLGTPAYSVFAGRPAAVDDFLVDQGKMVRITRESDLNRVLIKKKHSRCVQARPDGLKRILDVITETG